MKKKLISLLLCFAMQCVSMFAVAENPAVTGKVIEVDKFGHARLDITIEEFNAAGFELGDIVTVKTGTFEGDMPCFDGFYVESGEYMVRAQPGDETISVCINYGNFAEAAGISPGDEVTITLKEKAGALTTQRINSLVYTNEPTDYDSDEVFANFRPVTVGDIGEGKLYRSCSPVNNECGRRAVAGRLIEQAGLIHCTEGKDRAGFGSMIVEMLMGASEEEIVSDYLISYLNYYHLDAEADAEKLENIAEKNIRKMLLTVARLEDSADLASCDLAAAAEDYLIAHGMDAQALTTLKEKLR